MKILSSASFEYFERQHDEELRFIFFGPVSKKAWVERWYFFRDSKKRYPDICRQFSEHEGKLLADRQEIEPVLIWEAGFKRIYWFKCVFVKCENENETIDVVRGLVLEKGEREARRIERLRMKGRTG